MEADMPEDELFIVELDERMEFGVAAIGSGIHPDTNTQCTNGAGCLNGNQQGHCANYTACANSGC
jgi:hypothetical protein